MSWNRRGEGEASHSYLFVIGLIIGIIVLIASVTFALRLFGIISKPDDATMNSFLFLGQQLDIVKEGQTQLVPYTIAKGYYLVSGVPSCSSTQLCLCKDEGCEKIVDKGTFQLEGRQFAAVDISGADWKGVQNLKIGRSKDRLYIAKETEWK